MFRTLLATLLILVPVVARADPLTHLKVGFAKYGTLTDIWVATQNGSFTRHGLDVELIELNDSIQGISALQSKSLDIISLARGTAIAAAERGFNIVLLGQHETAGTTPPVSNTIVASTALPIAKIADLRGRKIGISSPRGQTYACMKELFQRGGLTMEDVQLIEAPFSATPDLLRSHQVDAIVTLDPYTTQVLKAGTGRVISYFAMEAVPDQPNGTWWAQHTWLQLHQPTAIAFLAAMHETLAALNADPVKAKQLVAAYTGLDPNLVKDMASIGWNDKIDAVAWQNIIDLMVRQGELTKPHKADEFLSTIPKS